MPSLARSLYSDRWLGYLAHSIPAGEASWGGCGPDNCRGQPESSRGGKGERGAAAHTTEQVNSNTIRHMLPLRRCTISGAACVVCGHSLHQVCRRLVPSACQGHQPTVAEKEMYRRRKPMHLNWSDTPLPPTLLLCRLGGLASSPCMQQSPPQLRQQPRARWVCMTHRLDNDVIQPQQMSHMSVPTGGAVLGACTWL
jgi:hypothetical protein